MLLLALCLDTLLTVGGFVGDGNSPAAGKINEVPRLPELAAAEFEHFPVYHRAAAVFRDLKLIGSQPSAAFSKLHRDRDRPGLAATDQLAESTPARHRCRDVLCQRFLEETENVE